MHAPSVRMQRTHVAKVIDPDEAVRNTGEPLNVRLLASSLGVLGAVGAVGV